MNLLNKIKIWRERRWFRIAVMLLKLALAAVIIYFLIRNAGIKKENFIGLDMRLVAIALVVILLQNLLTALRWWHLMRSVGIKSSLFNAVSLTMQGLFYTLFIPGGSVSGDVIKAALIAGNSSEGGKFSAAFSVFVDRVCGLCGLLMLSLVATVFALFSGAEFSDLFRGILYSIAIAAPVLLLLALLAFRCDLILKIRLFKTIYDWCDNITKGAISRIEAALAAYRPAWKTVLLWTLISGFIAFPLIALAVWLIAGSCNGDCLQNPAAAVGSLLSGSIGELAGVLPLTPGGIGVRDAAFAEIFKNCGLPITIAAQIPVIFTSLFVLASSMGAFFALYMLIGKRRRK